MSDSNSDSSQSQIQEQQDNRIAAAPGSINLVASRSNIGGNINITSTDHNTVEQSFDFAKAISASAASLGAATLEKMESVTTSSVAAVRAAYEDQSDTLANAYTEAKAGEQKVMVAVGVAAVALIAVTALNKKG